MIDKNSKNIVEEGFQKAYASLEYDKTILENGACELLARETLDSKDLAKLTNGIDPSINATSLTAVNLQDAL